MFDLFPSSSILEELVDRGLNRWHSFEELNYKKKEGEKRRWYPLHEWTKRNSGLLPTILSEASILSYNCFGSEGKCIRLMADKRCDID